MAKEYKSNLIPLIVGLLIFGATGWYGYNQFGEYRDTKAAVDVTDGVLFEVEAESRDVSETYQKAKKAASDLISENSEKIDLVFPEDEDLTTLTRLFDEFSFQYHYSSNPFFISQISYGDLSDQTDYRMLPINMTIETSEKNFYRFLEYIHNSGSLEGGIRLMSINGISLQISEEDADTLRVQLSMYAYLQNA